MFSCMPWPWFLGLVTGLLAASNSWLPLQKWRILSIADSKSDSNQLLPVALWGAFLTFLALWLQALRRFACDRLAVTPVRCVASRHATFRSRLRLQCSCSRRAMRAGKMEDAEGGGANGARTERRVHVDEEKECFSPSPRQGLPVFSPRGSLFFLGGLWLSKLGTQHGLPWQMETRTKTCGPYPV